ncbi:MAG: transposase [Desulfoferrobacter sp.]
MEKPGKRPRLKSFDYLGSHCYFVTICTHQKNPVFADSDLVEALKETLRQKTAEHDFTVWAYCFMPDHLHLLIQGKSSNADLRRFVRFFKQKTGFQYRRLMNRALWQPSYYDHVLRVDEAISDVARYIFDNPVRKGLVEHFLDYPHSGSGEFDLEDFEAHRRRR